MQWDEMYTKEQPPGYEQIDQFVKTPLLGALAAYMKEAYGASPQMTYSGCSMQKGWNLKYKKGSRALCRVYPMPGYFTVLVVIGKKEMVEAQLLAPALCEYTQGVFQSTPESMGQKWLMLDVKSQQILDDVIRLIGVRAAPKGGV